AAELAILPSFAIRQRLRARERMFAKEHEKIDLALHFELALHLVDLEEELPPRGVEQVVSVDRAARYAVAQQELAEPVVLYDLRELFTIDQGVDGHRILPPHLATTQPWRGV